mgnify:CR=1 FL=1
MTAYKLTNTGGYTQQGKVSETYWSVGETVRPQGTGTGPCGPGVLHLYASPEEAVLYDLIHGRYTQMPGVRCFHVEAEIAGDDGLKQWTTEPVIVVEEMPLPEITTTERVAWAICLAPHPSTRDWAVAWLAGTDRSWAAAAAAWAAGVDINLIEIAEAACGDLVM